MANESDEKAQGNGSGPVEGASSAEDLITDLEQQVAKHETANKELHDRLLRTAADFENFKRRTKKELDEGQQRGREQVIREILPVMDNLERALKHATAEDPLAAGVRMVEKQLVAGLEKFDVTRFSAVGQPFDPSMHDAIQQVESTELPPGTVAQEFASGYLSSGRLLRPAMVAVAKAPSPISGDDSGDDGDGNSGGGGG